MTNGPFFVVRTMCAWSDGHGYYMVRTTTLSHLSPLLINENKTTKKLKNCMQLKSMLENTEGGFPFFLGEYFGRSGVIHG